MISALIDKIFDGKFELEIKTLITLPLVNN